MNDILNKMRVVSEDLGSMFNGAYPIPIPVVDPRELSIPNEPKEDRELEKEVNLP